MMIVALLFITTLSLSESSLSPELIGALTTVRPLSELSLIISASMMSRLQASLDQLDMPISIFSLEQLADDIERLSSTESCPVYRRGIGTLTKEQNKNDSRPLVLLNDGQIHQRQQLLPWNHRGRTLGFVVEHDEDVDQAVQLLRNSVLRCEQKVDAGLLEFDNRILFIEAAGAALEAGDLFRHGELRRHRRVALIKTSETDTSTFVFNTFDPIEEHKDVIKLIHTHSMLNMRESQLWPPIHDYNGRQVDVGANVWAYVVVADALDSSLVLQPNKTQENFWGLEVAMLEEASHYLNFKVEYYTHPESLYGDLLPSGQWSGLVGWAVEDRVDLSLTMLYGHSRFQMVSGSPVILSMHMTFAAPWPSLYPKSFAIVRPFDLDVWLAVFLTFILLGLFFYVLAQREGRIRGLFFPEWARLSHSFWYCYGTMVGEAMTRDTKTHRAPALRTIVGVWTLYCFIASASYAGNLKTFLLSRDLLPPIDTLADVIDSELPWKMILYGEVEETIMAQSQDPVMQTIWNDKMVVDAYEIEDVYEGNSIFIDYSTGLEVPLRLVYSSPDGQPFIHISPVPMMRPSYMVWAFNKLNPLKEAIDAFMNRCLEAGLIDHWTEKTFAHMRLQARVRGEQVNIRPHIRPPISPMNLDDLQGAFFLFAILIALSIVYFTLADCSLCKSKDRNSS